MPTEGFPRFASSSCTRLAAASVSWIAWICALAMI
jgi:hypothetical protein